MPAEIHIFPAARSSRALKRALQAPAQFGPESMADMDEDKFKARARPLRASDLPTVAGVEHAEARLRQAVKDHIEIRGLGASAILLQDIIDEIIERAAS